MAVMHDDTMTLRPVHLFMQPRLLHANVAGATITSGLSSLIGWSTNAPMPDFRSRQPRRFSDN